VSIFAISIVSHDIIITSQFVNLFIYLIYYQILCHKKVATKYYYYIFVDTLTSFSIQLVPLS
jgi:hypothetical protein